MEEEYAVRPARDLPDLVRGNDHAPPRIPPRGDRIPKRRDRTGIEPHGGLVEEREMGGEGEGLNEEELPLHPVGVLRDREVPHLPEIEGTKELGHRIRSRPFRLARPRDHLMEALRVLASREDTEVHGSVGSVADQAPDPGEAPSGLAGRGA